MKKIIFGIFGMIFFVLFFQACSNTNKKETNEGNNNIIVIDINQKLEEKNIQDIAYSMTFLRLEESDDDPIGEITKLIFTNTHIFILDSQRAKSLFIYDREGRLKKVINKRGNGPGEFITPSDFDIQKNTGNIVILDRNQRKLLFYTKQGDFIKEFKTKTFVNKIATIDDNIILDKGNFISDQSTNYIRIINDKGDKITELLPIPEFVRDITISPFNPLQKDHDTILFLPSLDNKMYKIHGNEIQVKYQFDFGKFWPKKAFFIQEKNKHPLQIAKDIMNNDYVTFLNYLENKEVLHLNFYNKNKPHSFYYNKKNKQSILFISDEFPIAMAETSFVYVKYIEDNNPGLIFFDIKW